MLDFSGLLEEKRRRADGHIQERKRERFVEVNLMVQMNDYTAVVFFSLHIPNHADSLFLAVSLLCDRYKQVCVVPRPSHVPPRFLHHEDLVVKVNKPYRAFSHSPTYSSGNALKLSSVSSKLLLLLLCNEYGSAPNSGLNPRSRPCVPPPPQDQPLDDDDAGKKVIKEETLARRAS